MKHFRTTKHIYRQFKQKANNEWKYFYNVKLSTFYKSFIGIHKELKKVVDC